jgi:hypothetical protein
MTEPATNPVTEWRRALVELLAGAFPDAEVLDGYRTGLSRDKDRIAVYWPRTPFDGNPNYMRPQMAIAYFVKDPRASARLKEIQRDDAPLEQAHWDLSTLLLRNRQALLAGELYYELRDIAPNRVDFSVVATLDGRMMNAAALPA